MNDITTTIEKISDTEVKITNTQTVSDEQIVGIDYLQAKVDAIKNDLLIAEREYQKKINTLQQQLDSMTALVDEVVRVITPVP